MTKTLIALAAAALLGGVAHAKSPSAAAAVAAAAIPANNYALVIDMTGWETFAGFGSPLNSEAFYQFAPGTDVFGFDYSGVVIEAAGLSWGAELVLSVNDSQGAVYLDWAPSLDEEPGTFGPFTGTWNGPDGAEGPFGAGAPFSLPADGTLWVTAYESFNDAGDGLDATITAGTMTVYLSAAPIPEPSTYGLMALGLLGVAAAARRRKAG